MKLIIGLTGEKGSGKETFTQILRTLTQQTIFVERSSNVLRDTLQLWNIPATRENLQKLPVVMDQGFGDGALSRAWKMRIQHRTENIVIMDGVRWPGDLKLLRSFPNHLLIYITANSQTRFERLKNRNEKVGEGDLTWEQFLREEKAKSEQFIPELGNQSDVKIENNQGMDEMRKYVKNAYEKRILPSLT